MVFSSYLFVFGFLPAFLIIYFVIRPKLRNAFILVASLFFYYIGDAAGLVALLGAIVVNFVVGMLIGTVGDDAEPPRAQGRRKAWLWVGLIINLAVLIWYKYIGFFTSSIDAVAARFGVEQLVPVVEVALPLGISFFVFQGISYLIDVYRGTIPPTHNFIAFGAYKSLFPQLIAGPIVRYRDIAEALQHRSISDSMVFQGVIRFVIGFAKKVLLADTFALTADALFALPADEMSGSTAWLAAIMYTLQIYFDFSAYSDMAIGIALMMGFTFPENFNYPYMSRSMREFWRRWHMTLSSWFRDYVYVPLGGSRRGPARLYLNLFIVWGLTGLWHGASWTFVAWGLWNGMFIALERLLDVDSRRIPAVVRWVVTMLIVVVGWVLFRAESFADALDLVQLMCGFGDGAGARSFGEFWSNGLGIALVVGAVVAFPVYPWLKAHLGRRQRLVSGWILFSALFVLASMKVLAGAYSPFLYFRF